MRAGLGTRTAPCDAILEHSIAFKHPTYLQPEKQIMQTTFMYYINYLCKFLWLILSKLHILSACEYVLTEFRTGRTGKYLALDHGPRCARSVSHDLWPNIFPSGPPTQSISTYNCLDCDSYFPLIHLPSCYRTVCYRTIE